MGKRYATYEEFWPFYVSQHRNATSRGLHFIGTSLAMALLAPGFLSSPFYFIAAPVAGYGFAWAGHYLFEKNRPATFTYPGWSLRGDFRMWRLMLTGRMTEELRKVASSPEPS